MLTNKEDRKNGISIFIVDKDTPGFQVSRKIEKLGHRSSDVAELMKIYDAIKDKKETISCRLLK